MTTLHLGMFAHLLVHLNITVIYCTILKQCSTKLI